MSELATFGQTTSTTRAGFDQTAGQQKALTKGISAIIRPEGRRFFIEIERFASLARKHQIQCLIVVLVQVIVLHGIIDRGHAGINGIAELRSPFQPIDEHILPKFEIFDFNAIHLAHVHVVAVGIERVRIVRHVLKSRRSRLCPRRSIPARVAAA